MKKLLKTVNSKMITAQIRATEALKNNDGMEVIQFLGIAVVSITLAALVMGLATDGVETAFEGLTKQLNDLFPTSNT